MKILEYNLGTIFLSFIVAIFIVIGFNDSVAWRSEYQEQSKINAAQGCMEVGKIEYIGEDGEPNATQPNWEVFNKCMDEKGF